MTLPHIQALLSDTSSKKFIKERLPDFPFCKILINIIQAQNSALALHLVSAMKEIDFSRVISFTGGGKYSQNLFSNVSEGVVSLSS